MQWIIFIIKRSLKLWLSSQNFRIVCISIWYLKIDFSIIPFPYDKYFVCLLLVYTKKVILYISILTNVAVMFFLYLSWYIWVYFIQGNDRLWFWMISSASFWYNEDFPCYVFSFYYVGCCLRLMNCSFSVYLSTLKHVYQLHIHRLIKLNVFQIASYIFVKLNIK